MLDLIDNIVIVEKKLGEKESRKLQIKTLKNLIKKAHKNNIKDEELIMKIKKLSNDLRLISEGRKDLRKSYNKNFQSLKEEVKKNYGYVPKGTYIGIYLSIGVALGSGIGVVFTSINPALISIGIGLGISIGVAIGSSKEKEAEKDGKLY
ncbi:hypothetical protein [Sporosalibacterium faouarense]|uniref:hypothetical protein n=1 Tax=Sporosalibacterium faouarense TaxID=516123 RepID=UPI00141D2684|nr:hypothetical protein [Sporosalibacterium faouarense]MTI49128.1 hypothetical protein [Bacillota bacterium]